MEDEHQRPYTILFNGATDALAALEQNDCERAKSILIRAQQQAEEAYVCQGEEK